MLVRRARCSLNKGPGWPWDELEQVQGTPSGAGVVVGRAQGRGRGKVPVAPRVRRRIGYLEAPVPLSRDVTNVVFDVFADL